MMHEWDKDPDLRVCNAPNCQQHGKSPCEGVGCDGQTDEEREVRWREQFLGGDARVYLRGHASDARAHYVASCSCGTWRREGTADELEPLTRAHDDSPLQRHIVSILPCGPERDADFERARLARIAEAAQ